MFLLGVLTFIHVCRFCENVQKNDNKVVSKAKQVITKTFEFVKTKTEVHNN